MATKVRPPFDITKEFVVQKPFNYNGHKYVADDEFPWNLICCSAKDLYKYWDLRWLECKSEKNIEGVNSVVIEKEQKANPDSEE